MRPEIPRGLMWVAGLILLGSVAVGTAAEPEWELGWRGHAAVGRWTIGRVRTSFDQPTRVRLEWSTLDGEGHTARFSEDHDVPAGEQSLSGFFQMGRIDASVTGRLLKSSAGESPTWTEIATTRWQSGESPARPPWMRLTDRLIVTVGRPRGFDGLLEDAPQTGVRLLELASPAEFPVEPLAYDAVSLCVIAGDVQVSPEVSRALRDWVGRGGWLWLSVPKSREAFAATPLAEWLPVKVGTDPVSVRELGTLEAIAGRSVRIPLPAGGRLPVAMLEAKSGVVLAPTRETPLLVRAPYGLGEVEVLGLDLTQPPLSEWRGLDEFVRRVVRVEARAIGEDGQGQRGRQLSSTGITDFASQMQACQDNFPSIQRASPWWAMTALLIYLLIAGPLDYLIVHRVLRRPTWTWITMPMWVVLGTLLATSTAGSWNSDRPHLNVTDVADFDVSTGNVRGKTWATYSSPETRRSSITVEPTPERFGPVADAGSIGTRRLTPFAIPEDTFGGLYRRGGAEWGRTDYDVQTSQAVVERWPALTWSARTTLTEWDLTKARWVESDLHSSGSGRLLGRMTHRLAGPLEDWILIYGTRLFRRQPSRNEEVSLPWQPGEEIDVEGADLFQREARGVLTSSVAYYEHLGGTTGNKLQVQETRYDSLSRDPFALWHLLTFHADAGGSTYSGLTNTRLANDDLSRLIALGRAVVYGRLKANVGTRITVDGETQTADRHDILVRIVLPVTQSLSIERSLPKFEPK